MSWVEPQETTGSDLETLPLPARPRIRVERNPEPNTEGWHSWVVAAPNKPRRHLDTFQEALNYAQNLAIVNHMFDNGGAK